MIAYGTITVVLLGFVAEMWDCHANRRRSRS